MSKEDRMKRASEKKKGRNITLFSKKESVAEDDSYHIVASENEGIRTGADVKEWMLENNYIGTVYPVRIGKAVTRAERKVISFT